MQKQISLLIVGILLATSFVGYSKPLIKVSNPQKTLVHEQNNIVITLSQTCDPAPLLVNPSWWNANWTYRKEISIDHTKVSETLTNFPVLVSIVDPDLEAHTQANGNDIVFILYSDNTTKLNHEIENYTSSTGTLVAWVNITSLSSTVDTKFWMYYGNAIASNQQNPSAVWDNNYLAVYHMNDSGTATKIKDSTSDNYVGTKKAANEPKQNVTGKIGDAQTFDGLNDYITIGNHCDMSNSSFTLEAWAYVYKQVDGYIFSKGNVEGSPSAANKGYSLRVTATNVFYTKQQNETHYATVNGGADTIGWHHVVGVVNRSSNLAYIYTDGIKSSTSSISTVANLTTTQSLILGVYCSNLLWRIFNGTLDEMRISKIARSEGWILTEYANQNSPGTFLSEGSQMDDIAPTFSGESPTNSTTNASLTPKCAITINDADGETMNLSWLENITGSWVLRQTNTSCSNGTYRWIFAQVSAYSTKYWWKVSCNDTEGNTISAWYCFTTRAEHNLSISNPSPVNGSTGISLTPKTNITITDPDGDTITLDWFTNASGSWDNYGQNTSVGNGTYRQTASWASEYVTTYWWKVAVNDTYHTMTAMYYFMTASPPNQPPYTPSNPSPANGTTGVSVTTVLSWTGGDPDPGDTVTYDVYFGTTSSPPQIMNNQSALSYDPGTLLYNTLYYWRIIAWNNHGASAESPLWHFTTGTQPNQPPYIPSSPSPYDGQTDVDVNAVLSWVGGDPDPGDTVMYDVYFGTANPPPEIVANQSGTSYDPQTLSYNTQYYWKIVAWDNHGASAESPLWQFTTGTQPNQPPYIPNTPSPSDGAVNVNITSDLNWSGGDPDPGDTVTYDVYFSSVNPPGIVVHNQSAVSYDPGTMGFSTIYYWKIVAWDNHDASTTGPIWSFTTELTPNQPPYVPSYLSPVNDSTNVSINTDLSWTGGDPDPGDTVTYDVYFGTTSPPPEVMSNQSALSYTPGTLSYNTLYYWRIVAWDNHGASTEGPLWHFTTEMQPNRPPYAPSNPSPGNGSKGLPLTFPLSWNCSDPDSGDILSYDVYLGSQFPLTKIASNLSETSYVVWNLNYSMKYYWKIVAWDNHHNTNTSPLWWFTTINDTFPPSLAITSPKKGYLYVNVAGGKIQLEFPIGITTLVIGQVEVNTKVSDNQSGVSRVEFYVDDILKATDYTPPYNWTWSEHGYLFPYLLTITAYDNVGNPSTSSIRVWKIF